MSVAIPLATDRHERPRPQTPTARYGAGVARIWVVGNSGSGKTTLARTLATRLAIPHVELDAIYHQADWQPLAPEVFRARVAELAAGPSWVMDGNYSEIADLQRERADTIVWIDFSRARVMRQLAGRTLRRTVLRRELWNGNRESLSGMLSRDPEKSIMVWAWRTHAVYAQRYADLERRTQEAGQPDGTYPTVVRLRSSREIDAFLAGVVPSPG